MSSKSNRSFSSSAKMMRMEKSPSSKSPRARAHPLTTSAKKNSKHSKSQKAKRRSYDSSDLESIGSFRSNGSSKKNITPKRPSAKHLSPSNRSASGKGTGSQTFSPQLAVDMQKDIKMLQIQLSEVMEENHFLKSRLNVELKEKNLLEAKNRELNKNLSESKRVLQDTGVALMQVHKQTNELKSKRDEREIQLNDALFEKKELKRQVSELEKEVQMIRRNADSSATIASFQRMLGEKEELLRSLEEEYGNVQSQLLKMKKECDRINEEKEDLTADSERYQRRIVKLEKTVNELQDELSGAEKMLTSRGNYLLSGLTSINGSFAVPNRIDSPVTPAAAAMPTAAGANELGNMTKVIEGLLQTVEGRNKSMEDRMAMLESTLQRLNSRDEVQQGISTTTSVPGQEDSIVMKEQRGSNDLTDIATKTVESAVAEAVGNDALFTSSSVVDIVESPHKDLDRQNSSRPITKDSSVVSDIAQAPSNQSAGAGPISSVQQQKRNALSPAGLIKPRSRASSGKNISGNDDVVAGASVADGAVDSKKIISNEDGSTKEAEVTASVKHPVEETPSVATTVTALPDGTAANDPEKATSTLIEKNGPPSDISASSPAPSTAERIMRRYVKSGDSSPNLNVSQPKQENESNDDYIARLQREKKRMKKDIFIWTKDFSAKNSRQPTRQDREIYAAPMFRAYKSNAKLLKDAGVGESTKTGSIDADDSSTA